MYYGICASSECKNQTIPEFYSGLPLKTRSQTPVPGSPFPLLVTSFLKMRWSKKHSSDCVAVNFFFSSFHFLNALQSDSNSNTVNVLGHKYISGPSQRSFQPSFNGSG